MAIPLKTVNHKERFHMWGNKYKTILKEISPGAAYICKSLSNLTQSHGAGTK